MIIGLISFLGFFVCLIMLIVAAIKRRPKKPFAIGLAVCFVLFFVAALASPTPEADTSVISETEVSDTAAVTSEEDSSEQSTVPAEEKEPVTVAGYNVQERPVMNGTKSERIGTSGMITILDAEPDDELLTQICNDLDGLDYNWFTVDCAGSDGKGLCFPGCTAAAGSYGSIDEEGAITKTEKIIQVTKSGYTLEAVEDDASEPDKAKGDNSDGAATSMSKEQTMNAAMTYVEGILQQNYGDNYTLEYDETGITISVWQDGVAMGTAMAKDGDEDMNQMWETVVSGIESMSNTLHEQMGQLGFEDMPVMINVLNDQNKDNVLLTVLNGTTVYNAVTAG